MASSLRHPHPHPVTGNTQPLHCAGHTLGYQTRGELPDRPVAAPHNARTPGTADCRAGGVLTGGEVTR